MSIKIQKSKIKNQKYFLLFCLILSSAAVFGQDLIVTTAGDSLNCQITEVRTNEIFFRYDAGGSVVSLPISQVASFRYDYYKSQRGMSSISVSMRGRSELSVYLGGGMSGLKYSPDVGSLKTGIGGMFGIGYTWFVTGRWGILTGFEVSLYSAQYDPGNVYTGSAYAMSGTLGAIGDDFVFSYQYQNFSEKQSAVFLQIPAMAQFQTGRFFASAGIKTGIPIGGKYEITASNLTTFGDFPAENQLYHDLPDRGLGNIGATAYSGKLDLNIHYAASLEAGGQWFLGRRTNIYAGVWLDYGLNNLNKTGATGIKKPVVEYNHNVQGGLIYNSIIDTTDKTGAISAGVKVKLTYSL